MKNNDIASVIWKRNPITDNYSYVLTSDGDTRHAEIVPEKGSTLQYTLYLYHGHLPTHVGVYDQLVQAARDAEWYVFENKFSLAPSNIPSESEIL